MSQPVKLSDGMVLDARIVGELSQRSIAGQVEYWARLGRALEPLMTGDRALALLKAGAAKPLSECLSMVGTKEGHQQLREYLESRPYPHFEAVDGKPGLLRRIEADGTESVGRFVNRQFVAERKRHRRK